MRSPVPKHKWQKRESQAWEMLNNCYYNRDISYSADSHPRAERDAQGADWAINSDA